MTNKEIVELLCELVDLKELINRGLILKDINNFQRQLEKDLEVLEMLKQHLTFSEHTVCHNNKKNDFCILSGLISDENMKLFKEWLGDDKQTSIGDYEESKHKEWLEK